MKKYIRANERGIEIKISDTETGHDDLLSNFRKCQQGRCDCQTDEYAKLENMTVKTTDDVIVLHLTAKPGQSIDKKEVEKCLDFAMGNLSSVKD